MRFRNRVYRLRVGSISTLNLKTFRQLFWPTIWRKNSRKVQWQAQSRYLCHCAFLVSFRYAGSKKTWPKNFISISLALVTPGGTPSVINLALKRSVTVLFYRRHRRKTWLPVTRRYLNEINSNFGNQREIQ